MAKEEKIKYDGSDEEMMRLGLIDETGTVNNKRRHEFSLYMAKVWQKTHPDEKSPYTEKFPDKGDVTEYFANRAHNKDKRKPFLARLRSRNK